ncbi:lipoprotein-releasing ABC transporter permease subunit [Pseudidiomarina sp.]|uniref:lipoprotein-releasing ABC transporter permease subunit n=1 Tax=Pseudidiomarina sp. TaxID=2081707 RepID=UPI00299EACC3|nr:lipoprotein-releasing ABC transporter permease subunit [Pseudidiomarina sp.]MDX1706409.1 lipoprotein-releasing ABC transporter permease subunit [Pseudidiomarina sp.]
MFQPTALFLGSRYSRARHGSRFTRFINRFALAGILVGVAALIVVGSVMNGFEQELKQRILGVVPQLTVTPADASGLRDWQQLAAQLPQAEGQRAVLPQVSSAGVIQGAGRLRPVLIQGIFPDAEGSEVQLQPLREHLQVGELEALQPGSYRILIGQSLARELDVWPGDSLRVIAAAGGMYTPLGLMPAQRRFTVAGIIAMQSEADSQLLIMHGGDAARLLRMADGEVSGLRYYFDDPFQALPAQQHLQSVLSDDYELESWRERYGELFDAVSMEKRMVSLMLGLIIAVAAFNIVSSLMMLIQDKRSDIAILQTMGLRRRALYLMFMVQGLNNGVIGSIGGLLVGLATCLYLNNILTLLGVDTGLAGTGGLPVLMQAEQITLIVLVAVVLTLLATLYPAWRASRVLPAEALRYE